MSRIALDFAVRQRSVAIRRRGLANALAVLGLLSLGIAGWDYHQQLTRFEQLKEQQGRLEMQSRKITHQGVVPPELVEQLAKAGKVQQALQFPWVLLFAELESVREKNHENVALLTIKTDLAKNLMAISGETKDLASLRMFVTDLSASARFKDVKLRNNHSTDSGSPGLISFEIDLRWQDQKL